MLKLHSSHLGLIFAAEVAKEAKTVGKRHWQLYSMWHNSIYRFGLLHMIHQGTQKFIRAWACIGPDVARSHSIPKLINYVPPRHTFTCPDVPNAHFKILLFSYTPSILPSSSSRSLSFFIMRSLYNTVPGVPHSSSWDLSTTQFQGSLTLHHEISLQHSSRSPSLFIMRSLYNTRWQIRTLRWACYHGTSFVPHEQLFSCERG